MRKNNHSDRDIEELLKQMPKVKDQRGKREVYQNVTMKMNRRKRQSWLIPTAAAAAALLLLVILIPGMMGGQDSAEEFSSVSEDSAQYSTATNESADREESAQEEDTSTSDDEFTSYENPKNNIDASQEAESETKIEQENVYTTAVYEEELQDQEVLTYPILDNEVQNIVLVSVLVPKEEGKSKFDLYKETMSSLTEEKWGLSDNYPLDANLVYNEEQKTLTVDMFEDHSYSYGPANSLFINTVLSNLWSDFDLEEITLMTDGEPGVHFEHNEPMTEFVPNDVTAYPGYYLFYPNETDEQPLFVPYVHLEQPETIQEVFDFMKQDVDTHNLKASIPEDIVFEANVDDETVVITFTDESVIEDNEETAHMIEALLLTAKEFHYEHVRVENADVDTIGRFNLSQELELPIAPNQKELP
ncbi:hypothetical protein [Bacillus mesophilum]|uniref:GerMN domain-containing protein n=1 Tax=Bacillus mesophilum TaxID=1071718 RepID=A0A7V7RMV9_9BACI|nr:hypothetical protein [Bacillus mesophilum]KAB2333725.1 hypothetical protein F7732_06450 [Bacillus mesophilum]